MAGTSRYRPAQHRQPSRQQVHRHSVSSVSICHFCFYFISTFHGFVVDSVYSDRNQVFYLHFQQRSQRIRSIDFIQAIRYSAGGGGESEISCCVKYSVFGFNVLFFITGFLLLLIGVWAQIEKNNIYSYLNKVRFCKRLLIIVFWIFAMLYESLQCSFLTRLMTNVTLTPFKIQFFGLFSV